MEFPHGQADYVYVCKNTNFSLNLFMQNRMDKQAVDVPPRN